MKDWFTKKRWMVPEMTSGLHTHVCTLAHARTRVRTHNYSLNSEAGPGFCQEKHEGRVQLAGGFLGLPVTEQWNQCSYR